VTAAQNLMASLFGGAALRAERTAEERKTIVRKSVIFGTAGAAVVGGSVAAGLIFSRQNEPDKAPDSNVRIYLP